MRSDCGFLLFISVIFCGGLNWAQEVDRTPEELANLPVYERLLVGNDAKKAEELQKSYDEAIAAEDWSEAKRQAQALLDFRIAKQGADHYEVTDARNLLPTVEIQTKLTPDERRQLAEANQQNEQLAQLYQQGQFEKAAEIGQRVLATLRTLLGENHPDYAGSLNNLALLYESMGEYSQAESLYLQARDLTKKLLGEKHPDYARSLGNLGGHFVTLAEYAKAEPLMLQARDLYKELLGEDSPDYIGSLNNLALLYKSIGAYAKAESLYLQARNLYKKLVGESHPSYALVLDNLAALYQETGENAKAESLCVQSHDLTKKLLGENHPDYAYSLNGLGRFYELIGEYAKAEPFYVRSLELRKKLLGENHPDYAGSLNNLALLYESMGEYSRAEPLYLQARDLYKKRVGESHPLYAISLGNLGGLYRSAGQYAQAELMLVQARDLRKQLLGENHPGYATSLNSLAVMYDSMGENAKAELLYVQSLDLTKQLLGESHPNYAIILNNLARLHQETVDYVKAETLLLECASSFEMNRIARATGFQRAIGAKSENPYDHLAGVSARLKKTQQAFAALERNLARAFLDVQVERRGQDLSVEQQARRDRIFQKMSPIEKRIAGLVRRANLSSEETTELEQKIDGRRKLNLELAELAAELSTQEVSDLPAIHQAIPTGHALLTWVDVTSRDSNLHEHWACVLTSNGDPIWVELLGSGDNGKWTKNDDQLPTQLREALAQPVPPSNLPELTEQLRRQRIEPVLDYLKQQGITQLYVVGVGPMAGVPVEVIAPEFTISYIPSGTFLARLPEKPKFENSLFAVGDPIYEVEKKRQVELTALPPHGLLIDALAPGGKAADLGLNPGQVLLQYAETKLTSLDDLKAAVQKASSAGAKTAAVTIWSVDEANKPSEVVIDFPVGPLGVILDTAPAPLALGNRRKNEALFASLRGGENWQDLAGTRYEVHRLQQLFPTATVLLDEKASEAAVDALRQSGDLGQFRYLHFATHGKGNNVTAFESKLVLSQDQPKGELKAGEPWYNNEISAREVLDFWRLNADLVTLSACQTGLGRQGGGDGLLGFAQAFLLSGSRSVCLSLWEVDDIATALLMQRFYQNLLGERDGLTAPMPKAKALEEAKQWLRNLNASEATALTAKLTGGIARGTRGEKTFRLPEATTSTDLAAGDDYRPYARPHYWSAFILIGDPE